MLGFFSSRPNWDSPTPLPAGVCAPPPFGSRGGGGGTHSLAGEGKGGPNSTRGQTLWYSRYICTLWRIQFTRLVIRIRSRCLHRYNGMVKQLFTNAFSYCDFSHIAVYCKWYCYLSSFKQSKTKSQHKVNVTFRKCFKPNLFNPSSRPPGPFVYN